MRRCDRVAGILLLVLAVGVIAESRGLVYVVEFSPGAGFFPVWLGLSLLILSLVFLWTSAVRKSRGAEENPLPGKRALLRVTLILGSLLVTILAFEHLGFLLSMFLFVSFLLIYLEDYRWYSGIGLSAGMVCAIYALFRIGLKVPLPSGFFR